MADASKEELKAELKHLKARHEKHWKFAVGNEYHKGKKEQKRIDQIQDKLSEGNKMQEQYYVAIDGQFVTEKGDVKSFSNKTVAKVYAEAAHKLYENTKIQFGTMDQFKIIAEDNQFSLDEYNKYFGELDEISKKTLGSYVNKAATDLDDTAFAAGDSFAKGKNIDKLDATTKKRRKGIETAVKKLTKEETDNIDESELVHIGNGVYKDDEGNIVRGREGARLYKQVYDRHYKTKDYQKTYSTPATKIYHNVPFKDKDAAKAEGMRFDGDKKKWYHTDTAKSQSSKFAKLEEEYIDERTLTSSETDKKEEVVKSMKKKYKDFKSRYGDRAKEVMYATATKIAKED